MSQLRWRVRAAALILSLAAAAAFATTATADPFGPPGGFTSAASGNWNDANTWIGPLGPDIPASTDSVTVMSGDAVDLTADTTVGDLTISDDSTVDLHGHTLTVSGKLTVVGSSGHAANVSSTGGTGAIDAACLETGNAALAQVDVSITDAQSCTQTTILGAGTTWNSTSFSQTGGNATIGSDLSYAFSFDSVALRIVGNHTLSGDLTLAGTGSVNFIPTSTASTPLLDINHYLTGASTPNYTATVDWSGVPSATSSTTLTLMRSSALSPDLPGTFFTAPDTADTHFASAASDTELSATFIVQPPSNSGAAPSVASSNALDTTKAAIGDTLTCSQGGWTGATSYAYAWKAGATTLPGSASTYTVRSQDVGTTITCVVTATGDGGNTDATAATGIAVVAAPAVSTNPSVTSDNAVDHAKAKPGDMLTCPNGTWTGSPTTYTRAWKRNGTAISGQTGTSYTVTADDFGKTLTCAVTATGVGGVATATSGGIEVPAAPAITFDERPGDSVADRSTRIRYSLSGGATVTGCALSGTALSSCDSGLELSGYANGSHQTFSITVRNAVGATRTAEAAFDVKMLPLVELKDTTPWAVAEIATFVIDATDATSYSCDVDGLPFICGNGKATFTSPPLAPNRTNHTVTVTATNDFGSTTKTYDYGDRDNRQDTGEWRPLVLPINSTVTRPMSDYWGPSMSYGIDGGGTTTRWNGDFPFGPWSLSITAPSKPGKYTINVRWNGWWTPERSMDVYAYDPNATAPTPAQLTGVADAKAALVCPKGPEGTVYDWYVNGLPPKVPVPSNVFPAELVPKNGTVWCSTRDGKTGAVSKIQVLIDGSTRYAVSPKNGALTVSTSGSSLVEIVVYIRNSAKASAARAGGPAAKKGSFKKVQTIKVKLRRGANTIKLAKKLGKSGYKIELRPVHKKGKKVKKGKALVIQ